MPLTRRSLTALLTATSTSLLTSCGTLLYPERRTSRKDQTLSGEVDWFIFGLDAVGLVFFLVPGIIAFAVDFGTGAIFIPEGGEILDKDEKTIFDELSEEARINTPIQSEELFVVLEGKTDLDLRQETIVARQINSSESLNLTYAELGKKYVNLAS